MLGGIVGDAFGSPYQFRRRDTFVITDDMEPCENFGTPPGAYTDDSAMMLCLARSLAVRGGFDATDQIERYARWLYTGYMSSMDYAFDIGQTAIEAVGAYARDKANGVSTDKSYAMTSEAFCGNGGIMRLAPAVIFADTRVDAIDLATRQCAVTHANPKCIDCAALMAHVLWSLLHGESKEAALDLASFADTLHTEEVRALCRGEYKSKTPAEVQTSGYVVHTLEAALWTLWHANTYEEGIKILAAMGDDADTTCCVYGQLAGALYGDQAIPGRWLGALRRRSLVEAVVDGLVRDA